MHANPNAYTPACSNLVQRQGITRGMQLVWPAPVDAPEGVMHQRSLKLTYLWQPLWPSLEAPTLEFSRRQSLVHPCAMFAHACCAQSTPRLGGASLPITGVECSETSVNMQILHMHATLTTLQANKGQACPSLTWRGLKYNALV